MTKSLAIMASCFALFLGAAASLAPTQASAAGIHCRIVSGHLVCGSTGIPIPTVTPKAS